KADEIVRDVENLVTIVFGGKLKLLGFHGREKVTVVAHAVHEVVDNFAKGNEIVDAVFAQIDGLYPSAQINSFVSDSKELSINAVITSVANILVVPFDAYKTLVRDIEALANSLVTGPVIAPEFNDAVKVVEVSSELEEILTNFVTGKVVETIFDEIEVLYTDSKLVDIASTSEKLSVNQVITSVANIVVEATPSDADDFVVITKDIANLLVTGMVIAPKFNDAVKLVELTSVVERLINEFLPEEGNAVVTTIFDEIEVLYTDSKLVDISATTMELEFDAVVGSVANIAVEAISDNKADEIVRDVESLVTTVFGGKLEEIGYHNREKVTVAAHALHEVVDNFANGNEVVDAIFAQIDGLYVDSTLASFVGDSKELSINEVITSVANVLVVVLKDYESMICDVAELANLLVTGMVIAPKFNDTVKVVEVTSELEGIVTNFVTGKVVETIFDEIEVLYTDSKLVDIVSTSENLSVNQVITSVANVLVVAEVEPDLVRDIEALLNVVVGGELNNLGLNNATIVSISNAVYAIVDNFAKGNAIVAAVFAQIDGLYVDSTLASFVSDSKELSINAVITSVANVLVVVLKDYESMICEVAEL
ncbi:MAG: hypothetical protein J6R88_05900, partial [Clostridia bacterium]|nr:hypothetical protein [Clostridia bacterium]